jgi:hypothetical protein
MLTTTLDGLWVLQVLTGIEVLAPELGLRAHLPSVEPERLALAHPVAAELRAEGVIDEDGVVDEAVVEWLTVLSRRDVALLIHVRTPNDRARPAQVLLARFAQWWVSMERTGDLIRLSGVGAANAEGAATAVINAQIERLCGLLAPARLHPVTLDVGELLGGVRDADSLRKFLLNQKLDADQVHMLTVAADPERSAQASIVAIQSGIESGPARAHVEKSVVTIIDTPHGRLVAEHLPRGGKVWMIIAPGNAGNIASAVNRMVRRLPADQEWYSYRKVM